MDNQPQPPQSPPQPVATLQPQAQARPKKSRGPLIGFIIAAVAVLLVLLLGGAAAAGYYFGHKAGQKAEQKAEQNDPNPALDCVKTFCGAYKPVIYLYPEQTEKVTVRLDYPAGLSASVPRYDSKLGWQVLAKPDGQLTDLSDSRTYPDLFWEGNPAPIDYDMQAGFVVAGSQTDAFLRQKLAAIGLSPAEINDFIAYWHPALAAHPYNLIHFAGSEYTDYAKLKVTPAPDSVLRVFMVYEPLKAPVSVTPQTFAPFQRQGFTVVEWGGTRVNPRH